MGQLLAVVLLTIAAALVVGGIAGVVRFVRLLRFQRLDASYRAAALLCNAEREVRAAQHREWRKASHES